MNTILLASSNAGKLKEFQQLLADLNLNVISQTQLEISAAIETGHTFTENALLKARHAAKLGKLPVIADDSGLIIDALNGAPGIRSARYAGKHGDTAANNNKVLREMHHLKNRQAYFHCCLVLLNEENDPQPIICTADWHGTILSSPRGTQGFGYDPIFYVPSHHCSAAELNAATKNKISHRAQAMQLLKQQLSEKLK